MIGNEFKRGLPKTGQTTSYRAGDDGDIEAGLPRAGSRFIVNGDGTIDDLATTLQWVEDPGGDIGAPWNAVMTWNDAVDNCLALTFAGYSDWRLPNLIELLAIVDNGAVSPVNYADFVTFSGEYWTSTTHGLSTGEAFAIDFSFFGILLRGKALTKYARPVRGGLI